MKTSFTATGEQLATALKALDVNFITGGNSGKQTPPMKPGQLLAALAQSSESRLRLSLIPLFLEHPEFAIYARTVAKALDPTARLLFQCYYTAAVWLQRQYRARLDVLIGKKPSLPDYFSRELDLDIGSDPELNLRSLAKRHQDLSGAPLNWLGTYQHAVQVWIKGLEIQRA
jgi:hypothetical protein